MLSLAIRGQKNKVSHALRLDGPKVAFIHGEDSLNLQALRSCHHAGIGNTERQAAILEDQFPATRQVLRGKAHERECAGRKGVRLLLG